MYLLYLLIVFSICPRLPYFSFFFFNDTATTEIYTLSLHDALPISLNFGEGQVIMEASIDSGGFHFLHQVICTVVSMRCVNATSMHGGSFVGQTRSSRIPRKLSNLLAAEQPRQPLPGALWVAR